jgi:hypothetical protein
MEGVPGARLPTRPRPDTTVRETLPPTAVTAPAPDDGPPPPGAGVRPGPGARRGLAAVLASTLGLGIAYGVGYTVTGVRFDAWGAPGWLVGLAAPLPHWRCCCWCPSPRASPPGWAPCPRC